MRNQVGAITLSGLCCLTPLIWSYKLNASGRRANVSVDGKEVYKTVTIGKVVWK